jgi:hypothetical protein
LEIYKWKSVHAIAIDHRVVVHLRVPLQEDHPVVVPLHHVHNLVKSVLRAEVVQTALAQHVKFLRAVKSASHAGFVPLHKNAINHEFVHAYLNQISQKTSLVKNSKRVFARSC